MSSYLLVAPQLGSHVSRFIATDGVKIYGATLDGELLELNGSNWVLKAPQLPGYTLTQALIGHLGKMYIVSTGGALLEWNGSNAWVAITGGPPANTAIISLASDGTDLFGGGVAFSDGRLYKWDGVSPAGAWVQVAPSINSQQTLRHLAIHGGAVWVFTDIDGYLAETVGAALVQRAGKFLAGTVIGGGLASDGTDIFAVGGQEGDFSLKKWDGGTDWNTLINDVNPKQGGDLFIHSGEVYSFDRQSGAQPLVKWDGNTVGVWLTVATVGSTLIKSMSFSGSIYSLNESGELLKIISSLNISPSLIPQGEAFGFPGVNNSSNQPITLIGVTSSEVVPPPEVENTTTIISGLGGSGPLKFDDGDIRLKLDPADGYLDFILADRDVDRDPGFETSVLITLATDKRADSDDILPDDGGYKGGWWGDSLPAIEGDLLGWKGWLLQRSKGTNTVISECLEYLLDGFQYMLDEGSVDELIFNVTRVDNVLNMGSSVLLLSLRFPRPGKQDVFFQYHFNWENQLLRSV